MASSVARVLLEACLDDTMNPEKEQAEPLVDDRGKRLAAVDIARPSVLGLGVKDAPAGWGVTSGPPGLRSPWRPSRGFPTLLLSVCQRKYQMAS